MTKKSMSQTDEFPTYVKDLIIRMDFIGYVPPSMKVGIKGKTYIDPEAWYTRSLRWIQGEDSGVTCDYIDKIIESLFQILAEHRNSKNKIRKTLIEKASIFRQGIVNLIRTYTDNPIASSKLRTSLSMLDVRLPQNIKSKEEPETGSSPVPRLSNCDDMESESEQ